jgi:hypothetical protein
VSTAAKNSPRKHPKASAPKKVTSLPKFWIRSANRELDRTGEFILKNLAGIRKEAASRASAA